MSNTFFERAYSLFIGPNFNGRVNDPNGVIIEKLRVSFSVEQTSESTPNTMTLSVYNLGPRTRSLLEENAVKVLNQAQKLNEPTIILNAGYAGNVKTLFVGDVADVQTVKSGADIITTIECGDGEKAFAEARLDKSFAPGTSFGDVLRDLKIALGVDDGPEVGLESGQKFENGLSLSGNARKHLDYLTQKQGLEWSIQNNKLQIIPSNQSTSELIFKLSPSSGLIGTPTKTRNTNNSSTSFRDGRAAKAGIEVVSLLNPELKPGRRILVESRNINGVFIIKKVNHNGDNYANNWYTSIEAVEQ